MSNIWVDLPATNIESITVGTVNQGSPNTLPNAWPVEVTEGGNVLTINSNGSINVANTANIISTSANLTTVTSSTSSQLVFSPSISRKGFILYNSSNSNCFVAFATVSTSSVFSIELNPGMTYQNEAIIYTGNLSVVWATANGFLAVTELV